MLQCDHAAQRSTNAHLGVSTWLSCGAHEHAGLVNTCAKLPSSPSPANSNLRTRTRLPLSLAVLEAVPLSALTPPDSSRYQEKNSVNQRCHAGHYPKRGECVAYLGSRLPSLVPSCYARKVVCSPARYKSHTPHYIARDWAGLPFFFCIRVSRSPSRHPCGLAASEQAAAQLPMTPCNSS